MIGKDIKSVGDVLNLIIPPEVLEEKKKEVIILDKWQEIVGKKECKYSRPIRLKKNVLEIEVNGSGWVQEIFCKSNKIIENTNKLFGYERIKKLKIKNRDRPDLNRRSSD